MSPTLPAFAFVLLALAPAGMQVALALGAPFGHLTMGGRWRGRLPPQARALCLIQAGAIALMAAVLVAVAYDSWPAWAAWPVAGVMALSVAAHIVTPSPAERRLWLPVTTAMAACAVLVAVVS